MKKILFCLLVFLLASVSEVRAADKQESIMSRIEKAQTNMATWLPDGDMLAATDPDLIAIRDRLLYGEIVNQGTLSQKEQALVLLAALTANQLLEAMPKGMEAALAVKATPVEIKETLYQCAPYVGFPKVEAALKILNPILEKKGIKLPLESQATVNEDTRLKDGLATQVGIFGDGINTMRENAPAGQKELIANYLSAFCFGDFYTRKALDLKMRELITFSAIVSLGGCDPQAKAHAAANLKVGNTRQNLVDALCAMLPVNGFPRTLNGLAAVNGAADPK